MSLLDCTGKTIFPGDRLVVGSNKGIRVGIVIAIDDEHDSISMQLDIPSKKKFTFSHITMGSSKFWIL